ncbi:flagellar biosynthesis anti-sigma factor FlgM [Polaromonas sp. CF318]|uniref:flagellar biosynthesis anti-sigma factor FlgM n=1 Tax=Polaromonas sp. CF318 TaxID=1144318 RepID=UPI0002712E58|nr:flagellar biosynthesis anti-sigma factor FlgM [Polaromonas sp. CF318]EJL79882.1 flagellar biosynthesis anti-sigma factor FlgM [Polaromonas sp. CF318]
MNIQKTFTFLKSVADSVSPAAAREGRAASAAPAPSAPARPVAPAPLLSSQSDFDAARVARIREEISAGRYQVNTTKIADGLLATVRDLLGEEPKE